MSVIQFDEPNGTEVSITNRNLRPEFHGEEPVNAMDIAFVVKGNGTLLNMLQDGLRELIFCNHAAEAGQLAVDLDETLIPLPDRRMPGLAKKQNWHQGDKIKGYRLIFDYGLGDEQSNIDLEGCTLSNRWFEIEDGEHTTLGFTIQYAGPKLADSDTRARLTDATQSKAYIRLLPGVLTTFRGKPKASKPPAGQEDLDGGDEDGEGREDGDEQMALTDLAGTGALDPATPEGALAASLPAGEKVH